MAHEHMAHDALRTLLRKSPITLPVTKELFGSVLTKSGVIPN
jgi:hypothetical protein